MSVTTQQVLLYVPNLIGYARIILLLLSLRTMLTDPYTTAALYMLSALLDAFDGMAARKLNQCTKFGAMLGTLTTPDDSFCQNSDSGLTRTESFLRSTDGSCGDFNASDGPFSTLP